MSSAVTLAPASYPWVQHVEVDVEVEVEVDFNVETEAVLEKAVVIPVCESACDVGLYN